MSKQDFEVTPDFSAVGASSYDLEIFKNGSLVSTQSGITGSAAIVQVNNGGNPPNRESKYDFSFEKNLKYSLKLGAAKIVKVKNGTSIQADLLVFTPVNPSVQQVDFFNSIKTTASGIPFFDIRFESTAIMQNQSRIGYTGDLEETTRIEKLNFEIYPNPFSDFAVINFSVPETERVTIELYGITGVHITTLFNKIAQKDKVYTVKFNAEELNGGIYFYKSIIGGQSYIGKIVKN